VDSVERRGEEISGAISPYHFSFRNHGVPTRTRAYPRSKERG
jgi:hypothetical protein